MYLNTLLKFINKRFKGENYLSIVGTYPETWLLHIYFQFQIILKGKLNNLMSIKFKIFWLEAWSNNNSFLYFVPDNFYIYWNTVTIILICSFFSFTHNKLNYLFWLSCFLFLETFAKFVLFFEKDNSQTFFYGGQIEFSFSSARKLRVCKYLHWLQAPR